MAHAIATAVSAQFLTEARASASVKGCGGLGRSVCAPCEIIPGERIHGQRIITRTTDYGTNDHLVGTLKGVILKINPM